MNTLMFVGFLLLFLGIILRSGAPLVLIGGVIVAWCVYINRFGV